MNDTRKFKDRHTGKTVYVDSGKSVIVKRPPKEGQVWEVKLLEEEMEKEKTKVKIKGEEKQ